MELIYWNLLHSGDNLTSFSGNQIRYANEATSNLGDCLPETVSRDYMEFVQNKLRTHPVVAVVKHFSIYYISQCSTGMFTSFFFN